MEITGAIFDFDGTLFDSMPAWIGIRDAFFASIGVEMTDDDREFFRGKFTSEALPLAIDRFGLTMPYDELQAAFFEYLKQRYLKMAVPKNDIVEFLRKLQARGVKIGIATASGEPAVIGALEKFGLREYFPVICSTYTVGVSKLEPKVYDVVLEALGTDKATTWVFEDALYAAKTAKENGYPVVGIYDESEKRADELRRLVDFYIHDYAQLDV
ncbi:MAG: HAD family phosphatase [Oscillospiraceae bacterium]|nr:HAD family phosphatase [Oscillospiraceae bacterium]